MTDAVSICNLALQRLGAKAISSLAEDSTAGRECNRVYEHARDSELRSHPWSFARTRVELAAEATAPIFGYAQQYPLPSDYLRILPTAENKDWQIEGRKILTDDGSPIKLTYVKQVTDPNAFDAMFTELLVARIAFTIAEKITQSNSKKDAAERHYVASKREAKKMTLKLGP